MFQNISTISSTGTFVLVPRGAIAARQPKWSNRMCQDKDITKAR
jgi:hypothetical protein